jgi:hypothetical protein
MNLADLIDYIGNLVDYDPVNEAYRAQLTSLINEAQVRILSDRPWTFAQRERPVQAWTDTQILIGVSAGSAAVTGGPFGISTSTIKPGSNLDGAVLEWTDSGGKLARHTVAWVKASNSLFLDRDYEGASGSYTATVYRRQVFLPSDSVTVQNLLDPIVGIPNPLVYLSKFERENAVLDAKKLGRLEAWVAAQGKRTPAPSAPRGVAVVSAAPGQGVRTVHVWMVNVLSPFGTNFPMYPLEVSDGFESGLSSKLTFELTDTQTLTFTPEVIPSRTGLYRRYYFTCPEAKIAAPLRIRNAATEQTDPLVGVDTVNPEGSVTLKPNLALATLLTQGFLSTAIRYVWSNAGAYQAIELYPHPTADQAVTVRALVAPLRLQEDQDVPLIPESHAKIIGEATLETLSLKVANPALAEVYARKKDRLYMGMEQAFLERVPRRIVKGDPVAGTRFARNPYGPMRLVP